MNGKRYVWMAGIGLALCVGAGVCLSFVGGCEQAKGLEGLRVVPADVTLTPGSNTVTFTAIGITNDLLALPLEWSVSDPSLGSIIGNSGKTALYRRGDRDGQNIVTVRDQYENEGYAVVKQITEQYTVILNIVDGKNPMPADQKTLTLRVSGCDSCPEPVAPFDWWVNQSALGEIVSGADSDTAVYRRTSLPGSNVIHVRDANGVLGTFTVTQLGTSTTTNTPPTPPGPGDE